jgi:uncharacterized lipoprotein YddW (UPF0748 family)
MTDNEFAAEIADLARVAAELEEIARAMSNQLAPVKRREADIRNRIAKTYRHKLGEDEQPQILGFRGETMTVRSTRIQAVRQVGENKIFEYGEVDAVVVISDVGAAAARMLLYDDLTRLAEQYGHQRNQERDCYANLKEAQRTIDRLRKARQTARDKAEARNSKRKGSSNDKQASLL